MAIWASKNMMVYGRESLVENRNFGMHRTNFKYKKMTGGHLIEFHLIESLDRNFLIKQAFDQNCVLSLDRNF